MAGDDDKTSKTKINMTYYLGSSDGPGNIITLIKFLGDNYDEWARAVRTSLKAKRKFGFIEGTITKPTDSERLEDWMAVHSMLVSWITNTLDSPIRSTLGEYDDAQVLWNNLKNRYCVVNGTRICQLKSALGECKQGNTETVAIYFSRLSKIWDELNTYVKVPICKCDTCKCNIVDQVEKLRQEDYVHHFLIGFDATYSSIRAQLLAQDPLPGVDKAYQQVIQTERLRGEIHTSKDDYDNIMAFQVEHDARVKSKFMEGDKFCEHCNREGHDESGCFQIHGFPEWWGDRPRGGRGPGRGGTLFSRGSGHSRISSGRGHGTTVRANIIGGQIGQQAPKIATTNGEIASGLEGISSSKIQQLLDVLNSTKLNHMLLNSTKLNHRLQGPTDEDADWSG